MSPALRTAIVAGIVGMSPAAGWCGAQMYEPLAASVQSALSRSVADRAAPPHAIAAESEGERWLAAMDRRLAAYMDDPRQRQDFLTTVHYESRRAGLDPQLVLGVIDVESRFRKYAVSRAGARGYMQVMPFWTGLIGAADHNLFYLRTNLRYGCVILRHYLDVEKGDLARALARYNGTLGRSRYAQRVMSAWSSRWQWPVEVAQPVRRTAASR